MPRLPGLLFDRNLPAHEVWTSARSIAILGLQLAFTLAPLGCQMTSSAKRDRPPTTNANPQRVVIETPKAAEQPAFIPRGKIDELQPIERASGPYVAGDAHIQPAAVTSPPASESKADSPSIAPPEPAPGLEGVKKIVQRAELFQQKYPDYILRLTRNERVRGTSRSPEIILMKLQSNPRSVYLKWLDEANEGRECIWAAGKNNGKMVSRGGKGDLLLAGKTLWLDPDGTLARSKSTQPITESGLDVILGKIQTRISRLERNDASLGTLEAKRGPDPVDPSQIYDWVLHQAPRRVDVDLPDGGTHRYGFRLDNGRIEVVHAADPQGQFVYTFRFDRFIPVSDLTERDFDPEAIWPKKQASREPSQHEKMVLSKDQPAF